MERRRFLKAGIGGALAATAAHLGGCASDAQNRTDAKTQPLAPPAPDELAAAAKRQFITNKKTCVEAMVMSGCECCGVKDDALNDAALGLGGGIGLQGEVCGALTGGAMVLSMAIAPQESDYKAKKMRVFKAVGDYVERFRTEFKSLDCRTLSGLDLTTAAGRKELETRVKVERCAPIVEKSARMVAAILAEDAQRKADAKA